VAGLVLGGEFLVVGLEGGPDLGDHGEGVVDLLLEVTVFVFEFIELFGQLAQCLLRAAVETRVFLLGLGLLLESLDEGEDLLLLLGRQVVQ